LLALTAGDLMTTPVLTIPQQTPLREAARLLGRADVSGAPVVNGEGRCIGVLSSHDFVRWGGMGGEVTRFLAPWGELIDVNDSPDEEIRHFMTAQLVAVEPRTPIGELAQKMVDAHIHRILVVYQDRPRGIVTSTDVLAAVANAARKAALEGES
jgi:CBS domain-containing protein